MFLFLLFFFIYRNFMFLISVMVINWPFLVLTLIFSYEMKRIIFRSPREPISKLTTNISYLYNEHCFFEKSYKNAIFLIIKKLLEKLGLDWHFTSTYRFWMKYAKLKDILGINIFWYALVTDHFAILKKLKRDEKTTISFQFL